MIVGNEKAILEGQTKLFINSCKLLNGRASKLSVLRLSEAPIAPPPSSTRHLVISSSCSHVSRGQSRGGAKEHH